MKRGGCSQAILYTLLGCYAIITFLPFAWALSASFKPLSEIVAGGTHLLPQQFTLLNYQQIFSQEPLFGRWLFNSVFVAVCVTGCNLLFNSMAGYALARIAFPGNQVWFFLVLAVFMIPGQITLIPTFLILKTLGWLNSYQGLIVPSAVNATFILLIGQ